MSRVGLAMFPSILGRSNLHQLEDVGRAPGGLPRAVLADSRASRRSCHVSATGNIVYSKYAYPLGYTLSCDFLRSPNTQIALSALHRLQGVAPSHFDFFKRQRSQALHTRFLVPSPGDDGSAEGVIWAVTGRIRCSK